MNLLLIILYFFISAIFTRAYKKKYGFLMNPHVLFTWFWSFCSSLTTCFSLFGLRSVGIQVHLYSLLFLFTFNVVSYLFPLSNSSIDKHNRTKNVLLKLTPIRNRLIAFEIVALVFYSQYFFMSLAALVAGNAALIRSEIYFAQEDVFFTRLIPSAVLSALVYVSLYLYYKTKNKFYIINAIFLVAVRSITSMGRGALLSFIIINVLLILLDKHKLKLKSKPVIIGMVAVVVLTVFGRRSEFVSSFVSYFSGSFAFLDYIVNNPRDYGLNEYHYGLLTFSPVTEPLLYFLKVVGVTTAKIPSYWINLYVQDFVDIGDSYNIMYFNNNTTTLLPFLLDFGTFGIILGAAFLAILSMLFYRGYKSGSPVNLLIYIYIISGLFTATMSYQFLMGVIPLVTLACFYIILRGNYKFEYTQLYKEKECQGEIGVL